MLFQPTNVIPDTNSGLGSGFIFAGTYFDVSWQVNGNSPMVAYAIYFYQNNASSTPVVSIPKTTLDTPFSGVDYQGNIQRYTVRIPAATAASFSAGSSYKMMIRQYYSSSDYIDQKSMSVFNCYTFPSISQIVGTDGAGSTFSSSLSTRNATFTATYSQSQSMPINWVEWSIGQALDSGQAALGNYTELYNSGKIYSNELKVEYDGFENGSLYQAKMTIETSFGYVVSAVKNFSTNWTEEELDATAVAYRLNSQSTAIKLEWSGASIINGVASGDYTIDNGLLKLLSGDVTWATENDDPLSIETPWAVLERFSLQKESADLLRIVMDNNDYVHIFYNVDTRKLYGDINGTVKLLYTWESKLPYDAEGVILVKPSGIQTNIWYKTGGLVPSESLTPTATLEPSEANTLFRISSFTDYTYTQHPIASISVGAIFDLDYIEVFSEVTEEELTRLSAMVNAAIWEYDPATDTRFTSSVRFILDFSENTLDAGNLKIGQYGIEGWAIYRKKDTDPVSTHLLDAPLNATYIYDYGCGSNEGNYQYRIYPIGANKYLTAAITSQQINPIWENWAIIEAEYNSTEDVNYVVNEYIFGKNLEAGAQSNNNDPMVQKNFTRYPTVMLSNANYQSGTLTSLIGHITYFSYVIQSGDTLQNIAYRFRTTVDRILADNSTLSSEMENPAAGQVIRIYYQNGVGEYWDDKKLRDAIWALSTTQNRLFLKSRKGDVMEIRIAGSISMDYQDGAVIQPITASVPWVQIADATHESIVGVI